MLNGKYIAEKSFGSYFTEGKIYDFVNGRVLFDDSRKSFQYENFESFERRNIVFKNVLKPIGTTLKEQYLLNQDVVRVVENRVGLTGFILKDRIIYNDGWGALKDLDDDMKCRSNSKYDINKIYESKIFRKNGTEEAYFTDQEPNELLNLVWERQEKTPQQIKKEEIEVQMRKLADELKELEV